MVDFIIDANLSFEVSQSKKLHALLEYVAGKKIAPVSRRKFMQTLDQRYNEMKLSLESILAKQKHLCTTCDVWTCRGQSYLGITVHFINENFKRESYALAFKQLYLRQTYDYLAKNIDAALKDFKIRDDQHTHMVTDGGSALCKAFNQFGRKKESEFQEVYECDFDSDCDDDSSNTVTTTTRSDSNDAESESSSNPEFMQNEMGELFQSEILDFDNQQIVENPDNYLGSSASKTQPKIVLPPQRRCYSHNLNLLSQTFEKKLPLNADRAFKAVYNKLHSLWNVCNRSSRAKTICKEVLGRILKVPCETRWNSKFDCVKLVFEIIKQENNFERNMINILIKRLKVELKSANHLQIIEQSDIIVIEKYIKVMEPVAWALDTLQGEYNCSQGYILPVLLTLKHNVNSIEENSNLDKDFKRTMLKV